MKEIRDLLERACPCCGGAGYYSGTGTETVRGKDGCPEPSPCEVQVQCDCNGIKIAEIKKIVLGWVGEDKRNNPELPINFQPSEIDGYNIAKAEIRKKVEGEL